MMASGKKTQKVDEETRRCPVHGQYSLVPECDYNLQVLYFLNTGAGLSACLSIESTLLFFFFFFKVALI